MDPPRNHVWLPKKEIERPSSSRSNQKVPNRIPPAITRAISDIQPSSNNQQANLVTENPPTHNYQYTSGTGSAPASSLSSILSRQVTSEPTSRHAIVHAPQHTLGAINTTGATSSPITDNQQSTGKETLPNPLLRTNLLTAPPALKDVRVTIPRGTRTYKRRPRLSTEASTSTDPDLRDPITTSYYFHKDKRGTPTQSAQNSVAHSPFSGNSESAIGTSRGIVTKAGPIPSTLPTHGSFLKAATTRSKPPTLPVASSVPKVSKTGTIQSVLAVPRSVPKVAVDRATRYPPVFYPRGLSAHQSWVDIRAGPIDRPDYATLPLGEKCQLCAIDLAFLPCNSDSGTSTDPPMCAILPCGHVLHDSCFKQVYGSSSEPQCLICASDPVKDNKQN